MGMQIQQGPGFQWSWHGDRFMNCLVEGRGSEISKSQRLGLWGHSCSGWTVPPREPTRSLTMRLSATGRDQLPPCLMRGAKSRDFRLEIDASKNGRFSSCTDLLGGEKGAETNNEINR